MPEWLPATVAVLLAVTGLAVYYGENIMQHTTHVRRAMSTVQNAVDDLTDQLRRAYTEITEKIADVQAQLDAASIPAEVVDLSALAEVAEALDDIVPDKVVEAIAEDDGVVDAAEELEDDGDDETDPPAA